MGLRAVHEGPTHEAAYTRNQMYALECKTASESALSLNELSRLNTLLCTSLPCSLLEADDPLQTAAMSMRCVCKIARMQNHLESLTWHVAAAAAADMDIRDALAQFYSQMTIESW